MYIFIYMYVTICIRLNFYLKNGFWAPFIENADGTFWSQSDTEFYCSKKLTFKMNT